MHSTIQKALSALNNAEFVDYFNEMGKLKEQMSSDQQTDYATFKKQFIQNKYDHNFNQRLKMFAQEVDNYLDTSNPGDPIDTDPVPEDVSNKVLMNMMDEAFDDDQFKEFLFNYYEKLAGNFSTTQQKSPKIMALVSHCRQHLEVDELLKNIRTERPKVYKKYLGGKV